MWYRRDHRVWEFERGRLSKKLPTINLQPNKHIVARYLNYVIVLAMVDVVNIHLILKAGVCVTFNRMVLRDTQWNKDVNRVSIDRSRHRFGCLRPLAEKFRGKKNIPASHGIWKET